MQKKLLYIIIYGKTFFVIVQNIIFMNVYSTMQPQVQNTPAILHTHKCQLQALHVDTRFTLHCAPCAVIASTSSCSLQVCTRELL